MTKIANFKKKYGSLTTRRSWMPTNVGAHEVNCAVEDQIEATFPPCSSLRSSLRPLRELETGGESLTAHIV